MKAGNDMIQPGAPKQINKVIAAVQSGGLEMAVLDKSVERILTIMLKTPRNKDHNISNEPELKAHADIVRKAASDGMVLLENNGVLPLTINIKKIAAFGNASYDFISGGTGSGDVNEAYTISLIQGLEEGGFHPR